MARCLGANSPYGCGHHVEHVAAAKKGWITRRAGTSFASSHEHGAISALFGNEITHAHEHETHKGQIVFKSKGQWYELPKKVFNGFVREGHTLQRQQEHDKARQEREDAKRQREYERGQRKYEQELAKLDKEDERERVRKEKREAAERERDERNRLKYEREQEREEKRHQRSGYVQYQEVVRSIRRMGGIAPNRARDNGKIPEYEEWKGLPQAVKTRDRRKGFALDDIAQSISSEFPDLGLERGDDLAQYLEQQYRRHRYGMPLGRHRAA